MYFIALFVLAQFAYTIILSSAHEDTTNPFVLARRDLQARRCATHVEKRHQIAHFRRTQHLNRRRLELPGILINKNAYYSSIQNTTCVLAPEVTVGPFYRDGELIRSNITEGQRGIPLTLDISLININTCEPIEGAFIDIWHANATGFYSAFNNTSLMKLDKANDQSGSLSFLRGVQPTDSDGIAEFKTIIPGWYRGRAVHIHSMVHINGMALYNGTLTGGTVAHVGVFYFPEDFYRQIEGLEVYNTNKIERVLNDQDNIFHQASEGGYSPYLDLALVGKYITDGVVAYINVGVDPTADNSDMAKW
ncbi:uncharacterized protein VTP21DRAFT_9655 [Calcarisporiella thermophila]|uniref:uncharacterized protein n=1 Tax=Calcarisporiella thermophila TaxID=911321 RepID=UPI003743C9A3